MESWRKCQVDALEAIRAANNGSGIVSMFCGTGKTRVISAVLKDAVAAAGVCVAVFPRLVLADQFREKYAMSVTDNLLFVSSDAGATTYAEAITATLRLMGFGGGGGLVCVTYTSLQLLCECLKAAACAPALVVFDEAHHVVADKVADLIAEHLSASRRLYFTATPPSVMQSSASVYGPVLYNYPFSPAVEDGIVQPVRIVVEIGNIVQKGPVGSDDEDADDDADDDDDEDDADSEDDVDLAGTYGAVVRAAVASNNGRVICFHRYASADGRDGTTSVKDFDTPAAAAALHAVWAAAGEACARFPTAPRVYALRSGVPAEERKRILAEFEAVPDYQLAVLHNCAMLAEGVDTAAANMAVFVDAKSAVITIVQNIGRVVRKTPGCDRPATILLPVRMDLAAFNALDAADTEGFNDLLFDAASEGRFDKILRVVEALVSTDPAAMAALLAVPPRFLGSNVRRALVKSGAVVSEPLSADERASAAELPVFTSAVGEKFVPASSVSGPFLWHNEDGVISTDGTGSWHLVEKAGIVAPYVPPVPPVSFVATAAPDLDGATSPAWVVEKLVNGMGGIRSAILSCLDGRGRDEQFHLRRAREVVKRAVELRQGAKPVTISLKKRGGLTAENVQERADAQWLTKIRQHFLHGVLSKAVEKVLTDQWPNWTKYFDIEQKAIATCQDVIARAIMRGGAMPRASEKCDQEFRDAAWIGTMRASLLGIRTKVHLFASVKKLLDAQWPDWAIARNDEHFAVKRCKDVIQRSNTERNGAKPKCLDVRRTVFEQQEHSDALWLKGQRDAVLGRNKVRKWFFAVKNLLDAQWPDWLNVRDLVLKAVNKCAGVIDRANVLRDGAMPRCIGLDKKCQESLDARWLAEMRAAATGGNTTSKLYPEVEEMLNAQWGDVWRADLETLAILNCKEVMQRADLRGGTMPSMYNKDADPQQFRDTRWLTRMRTAYFGKQGTAILYAKVKELLDSKWPDWKSERPRQRRRTADVSKEDPVVVASAVVSAGAGSGRARPAGPLTAWHQKWKSRTAASFVEAIQAAPEEWHKYHAVAAQQDARDLPETSVFTVLSQWLGKLAASQAGAASAVPPLRVVDLGCGTNGLKRACSELRLDWTCVDAVGADDTVTVGNLGALPDGGAWTGRFSAAVLSRALWATDKATVLAEVYRVLHHGAFLFVVEPVSKYRDAATGANTLPGLLTAAGFEVDLANSWGGGAGTGHTTSVYQFLLCKKPALAFL
jgi:superfamily II DNA or RNA helicase